MKPKIQSGQPLVYVLLGLCVFVFSCTPRNGKPQDTTPAPKPFHLPQIPAVCSTAEQRAEYLVEHYWDHFDFRDTSLILRPEITEQAFVDFIDVLPYVEDPKPGIGTMMDRASTDSAMFVCFWDMAEKYLYDPNSPMRNEELYIPVLEYILRSQKVDSLDKLRPRYQLEMALKNRPGMPAADFTYTTESRSGVKTRHMLHNLRSEYTLLFFNNPDCYDCARTQEYIVVSPVFAKWQQQGLSILAIYPDTDLDLWRKAIYPQEWINGYDAAQTIREQQLYDLKAIPTLYLLDRDKRVILKDTPVERIEQWAMVKWTKKK